jgi:hypothetical protein
MENRSFRTASLGVGLFFRKRSIFKLDMFLSRIRRKGKELSFCWSGAANLHRRTELCSMKFPFEQQ